MNHTSGQTRVRKLRGSGATRGAIPNDGRNISVMDMDTAKYPSLNLWQSFLVREEIRSPLAAKSAVKLAETIVEPAQLAGSGITNRKLAPALYKSSYSCHARIYSHSETPNTYLIYSTTSLY